MLKISLQTANAKATGRPYEYVSVEIDGIEVTRIFIKQTEKAFFGSLLGSYTRTKNQ